MRRSLSVPHLHILAASVVLVSTLRVGPAHAEPDDQVDGWLVDANIGAAKVESNNYRLAADAALGYWTGTWGVAAQGTTLAYDETTDAARIETTKLDGDGEAWVQLGDSTSPLRPELRVSVGGASYDSTYTPVGPGVWNDQTSWIWRGSLLLGLAWRPDESFALHVAGGGGLQVEWYDYESAMRGNVGLTDDENTTIRGHGRLNLRWTAAPRALTFRIQSSVSYFSLTRDTFSVTKGNTTNIQDQRVELSQVELRNRLFGDLDFAEFVGLRPTIHVGVDYVRLAGSEGSSSTAVPVAGVGLLRPWL